MVRLSSDTSAVQRLVLISLRIGTRAPLIMVGSLILMVNTSLGLALTMVPLLMMSRLSNVWANGMASSKWIYGLISTWFPGFTRSTTAGSPLTKQISGISPRLNGADALAWFCRIPFCLPIRFLKIFVMESSRVCPGSANGRCRSFYPASAPGISNVSFRTGRKSQPGAATTSGYCPGHSGGAGDSDPG